MTDCCNWHDGADDPPRFLGLCPTKDGAAGYEGFVASVDDALAIVRAFQNATNTRFVKIKQKKSATDFEKHKVFWEEPKRNICKGPLIQYDGVPFIIKSSTTFECQYGRDRHIARKRKAGRSFEFGAGIGSRMSRKQNCKAAVFMREICRFPQFRITLDSAKRRFYQAKKLRRAMNDPNGVVLSETRFYMRLPRPELHSNHPTEEASLTQPVDPQVRDFIRQQINAGVNTVAALQQTTEKFVEQDLFCDRPQPLRHDRRFFPGRRYYTNMLYRARHPISTIPGGDQAMAEETVEWEPSTTTLVEVDASATFVLINTANMRLDCENNITETKLINSTAAQCREVLNQLIGLTYRCTDIAHLEALAQRLQVAHLEFLAGSHGETGAVIEVPLVGRWESVEQSGDSLHRT